MPLFSTKGQFGIGAGNPQVGGIPRRKFSITTPEQPPGTPQPYIPGVSLGKPPAQGLLGGGGGGFMTGGGGSAGANRSAAAGYGDQMKQWLQQLAYGQGPFAKLMIDPSKAINAAMPGITEKMTGDFNEAANRLGATGMLGFSQGKMAAGTPYQDLLGQAAKSANLGREEIRSKYQFEADKANQDTMLALLDKFGIGGGVGGSAGGGDQRSYRGAMESAAGGGTGGDPTRDPSSIWYNDASGYKSWLAQQKEKALGVGPKSYETGVRDAESEVMNWDFGMNSAGPQPPPNSSDEYIKGWKAAVAKAYSAYKAQRKAAMPGPVGQGMSGAR